MAGGGRARATVVAVGLGMANVGFYVAGIGVVLVVLADDLGVPPEQLSWLGSAFGFGLIGMALAGPVLLSRLGQRLVLASSSVVLGTGSFLLAIVPGPGAAYAGALLQGVGAAGIVLVTPRLLHGEGADVVLTKVNAVASLVAIAAPLLLGLAATLGIGARLPLLLAAAAALVLAGVAWRLDADRDAPAPVVDAAEPLRRRTTLRRWLALVSSVSVEFAFVVWGVARLVGTGLDAGTAAIVATGFQGGMALGRLAGPWLIRHVPVVPAGVAVAATGTLLVVLGGSWPLVGAGQFLAGFGIATLYPITLARLMATPGLRPEVGASLGALGSGTAIVLIPTLLAALSSVVDLRVAFLVPLPLLGLLLWLHLGRDRVRT